MKKFFALLILMTVVFSINVYATDNSNESVGDNVIYEYFEDGSYIKTVFWCEKDSVSTNPLLRAEGDYTVTGHRDVLYYDGDDNLDWKVTLTGVFLVVPSNSSLSGLCQDATLTHNIYDSSWHISNIVASEITNNARGTCTMKRKFLGITTKTVDVDIYITCDSYGNLK